MKTVKITCLFFIILSNIIFASSKQTPPFILNKTIIYNNLVSFDAHSVVNGASEPRLLFYNSQQLGQTVEQGEPFYTVGINYSYKRIGASIQYFSKRYRLGGVYTKGIDSKGRAIRGYDKNLTEIKTISSFVIVPRFVLFRKGFADIGINLRVSDLRGYSAIDISFSKQFKKTGYTAFIGFESLVGMLLFTPYELAASFYMHASPSISLFIEVNYIDPYGGENYSPGLTNIVGVNYSVNKIISLSLFNYFLYNTKFITSDLPYSRTDNRIGIELKFVIQKESAK